MMNNMRGNKETIQEMSKGGSDDWRKVPLIHAQSLSFLKKHDYKSWIKQVTDKISDPLINIFGEEDNQPKGSKKEFLKVRNFI